MDPKTQQLLSAFMTYLNTVQGVTHSAGTDLTTHERFVLMEARKAAKKAIDEFTKVEA